MLCKNKKIAYQIGLKSLIFDILFVSAFLYDEF